MKRLLLLVGLLTLPSLAHAQCNGTFPNNTVCGNVTGSANLPRATSPSAFLGAAGGTAGQIQYNNAGALGGFTALGDCTINTATGAVTCARFSFITTNAKTADYTLATSDCGKMVSFSGGPFTATLPAAAGFTDGCFIQVCNINANSNGQRAVRLSGFPNPLFIRLWMSQCLAVINFASTSWKAVGVPDRWRPGFTPNFTIDTANGSDTNDGQVSNASGNALRLIGSCVALLQRELDLSGNIQPICSPTSGQTFQEDWSIVGPLTGGSVFNITGNGGVATQQVTGGGATPISLNDFAPYLITNNFAVSCVGGAAGCIGIVMHQQTGLDSNAGSSFIGGAAGHIGITCDSQCKINVGAAPLNVSGTFNYIAALDQGSIINVNSGIALAAGTTIGGSLLNLAHSSSFLWAGPLTTGAGATVAEIFTLRTGATGCMNANFTTAGAFGAARQWSVLNNAFFGNVSAVAIPGGTPGINTAATFANGIIANAGLNSGGC